MTQRMDFSVIWDQLGWEDTAKREISSMKIHHKEHNMVAHSSWFIFGPREAVLNLS